MNSDADLNPEKNDGDGPALRWIANAISIQVVRGTIVLRLHEQQLPPLDKTILTQAREQLATLASNQSWNAVFDLQGTPIVGSSVLGFMVMVRKFVHAVGGQMAVCNASDMIREKMDQLNLTGMWLIAESLDEALKAVNCAAR